MLSITDFSLGLDDQDFVWLVMKSCSFEGSLNSQSLGTWRILLHLLSDEIHFEFFKFLKSNIKTYFSGM